MTLSYELSSLVNDVVERIALDGEPSQVVGPTDILGRGRTGPVTKARQRVVVRAYVELGMSIHEISEGLGLDRSSVYYFLEQAGINLSVKHYRLSQEDYEIVRRQMAHNRGEQRYPRLNGDESLSTQLRVDSTRVMEFHGPLTRAVPSPKGTPLVEGDKKLNIIEGDDIACRSRR